jgi:hypothetical protein
MKDFGVSHYTFLLISIVKDMDMGNRHLMYRKKEIDFVLRFKRGSETADITAEVITDKQGRVCNLEY